jgi:molybdopterin synthase catalytic subunit
MTSVNQSQGRCRNVSRRLSAAHSSPSRGRGAISRCRADHRQAAFDTCARLVDTVKARLPVWKHQLFADGSDEWVGSA